MIGRLLTTRQVGELLGLSPATVLRHWRAGKIPGYRLGSNVLRFDLADIEAYLVACRRGGREAPAREPRSVHPDPVVSHLPGNANEEEEGPHAE